MGKRVKIVIGEGVPPPWVPFSARHTTATTVDTSQRSMDVAKMLRSRKEDPEFICQRRTAIKKLFTGRISKRKRFSTQDVMKGRNVAIGFAQAIERKPIKRPKKAPAASPSTSNKPDNLVATAATSEANKRLPKRAKKQIADKPIRNKKLPPQSDLKQHSKRNFNNDGDRPKRRGSFGRNRRSRGLGDDDGGGEKTHPRMIKWQRRSGIEQEQLPPPPASQRTNPSSQYQQPPPQQRNQPVYPQDQSGYGYYNQQQQQRDYQNRPNSGRGYPQQQYPNRYDNNYYY